jgi:large repetitive protein
MPDLTGIPLREISCLIGATCGLQYVDTPVAMTITNTVNTCTDTLQAAIYIHPCDLACRPAFPPDLLMTGAPASVAVGSSFVITLGYSGAALTTPVTVTLTYTPGTVLSGPSTVVIPANFTSAVVPVNALAVGTGIISAQVGSGVCAVNAIPVSVNVTSVLQITTTCPMPDGTVGVAYSETLTASGGTTPYTWAVTAGALPVGLTLDPAAGTISGANPTTAGTFGFTLQVTDSSTPTAYTATRACSITIN